MQAVPAAEASTATDGDIIVTAQRRTQRLVDVPISISTATSADLERAGPTSIENLTKITPGIYLQRAAYGLSPTVRGIGSTLPASGGEQIVALYVDEIYYPTPTGNVFDLASIAGVEVLKGPQGTLFGRNATGGAILLRTLDPGFTTEGRFNLSIERFDQIRTSAYVNVPVSKTIAINASFAYRYSNGYVHDLRTDQITNQGSSFTARGKLLFQPTDNFSVIFTAAHADLDDPTGTDFRNLQPAPLVLFASGGPIATDRFHSSAAVAQHLRTNNDEYSARAKLDTDAGTLSSFTAFLKNKLDAKSDLTGSYLAQDVALLVNTKTFSQEVNFASKPNRPLTYVVGIYYFRSRSSVPLLTTNGAPLFNSAGQNDAIAGYADGTYTFGKLSVIAGVRYSYEKRRGESAFGVSAPAPFTRFQRAIDKQWTPRFGLRYALADRTNIYATYSKGFKSGSFDASSPTGPGVVPETVDAFEVGFKHASRAFSFNAATYYYDYKNTQVNATVSGTGGAIVTQLFNVPKSRIYGAEADATLRLNDNFDLHAAVAYTHARYIDFKFAPGYVNDPSNPSTNPGGAIFPGALFANVSLDVSGKHMVRAPDFTASSSLTYHTNLSANKALEITLSPYYSSRVYFTFDNSLSQKPYATLDGAVTLTVSDTLKLSVFGRNLTNSNYAIGKAQNALSLETVGYAVPRVYGVSIGYSF
jgi:iron complex outermembrane receptor protein